MKAIIMAGGEGSRLRPLTCDCPKPMVRLMDKPVMETALELLRAHGITQIAATLGYLPDAITDHFGDGSAFGVELQYFIERSPLGTAGGVRQARDFLDETFIVLSGDGVTDLNISAALDFHRSKGALATLILRREEDPSEYGVVSTDEDGRVTGFCEKPGRCDVISDTINTGIYILEPEILDRIPENMPYDFGHDLFPMLVREGAAVYGCRTDGYWCDIGDVRAYLNAHAAAMNGEIHLDSLRFSKEDIRVMPGAFVHPTATLEAPCLIASGARIGENAFVGAYSVVGKGCIVGERASLKRAILWPDARLEPGAQARGCVLTAHARLGQDAQAYEESMLGTGASLGERAILMPGVRIWPEKRVEDGERVASNLVWGHRIVTSFSGGMFPLADPAQASRAAQAYAAALTPGEILVGRGPSAVAGALWHAVAAGVMAQGAQVLDAGVCTLPQLRHGQCRLHTPAAIMVDGSGMIPLSANGAKLSAKEQRTVSAMIARQDFSGPFTGLVRPILSADHAEIAYIADTAALFDADPHSACGVAVHAQPPHLLSLAERVFARANLSARTGWEDDLREPRPGELGIRLSESGESALLATTDGSLTEAEHQLLRVWIALEDGERELILPVSATRAAAALAEPYHARVTYVAGETSVWMNALAERSRAQFDLWFDGIQFALRTLSLLTRHGLTLDEWKRTLPGVNRQNRVVPVPAGETGHILNAFARRERDAKVGGGVQFSRKNGWAWICPDEQRPEFHIITESQDAEFARELCDFCAHELERLSGKTQRE